MGAQSLAARALWIQNSCVACGVFSARRPCARAATSRILQSTRHVCSYFPTVSLARVRPRFWPRSIGVLTTIDHRTLRTRTTALGCPPESFFESRRRHPHGSLFMTRPSRPVISYRSVACYVPAVDAHAVPQTTRCGLAPMRALAHGGLRGPVAGTFSEASKSDIAFPDFTSSRIVENPRCPDLGCLHLSERSPKRYWHATLFTKNLVVPRSQRVVSSSSFSFLDDRGPLSAPRRFQIGRRKRLSVTDAPERLPDACPQAIPRIVPSMMRTPRARFRARDTGDNHVCR